MKYSLPSAAALAYLLMSGPAIASAESLPLTNPILPQLAEMSGAATAGIELCDMDKSLAPDKSQQRDQFIQMGGTPEAFATGYQTGYDRAQKEYKSASPQERKQMCDKLIALLSPR